MQLAQLADFGPNRAQNRLFAGGAQVAPFSRSLLFDRDLDSRMRDGVHRPAEELPGIDFEAGDEHRMADRPDRDRGDDDDHEAAAAPGPHGVDPDESQRESSGSSSQTR